MKNKVKNIYKGPEYPTKAYGKIPTFHSYEEEAVFWDTHDITSFEDETDDVDIIFDLENKRDEVLVLRVQKKIKDKQNKVARRKGLNISALARMWILEKLQTSSSTKNY